MQNIAFWLDFFAKDSMKREGTFRFSYSLIENLIINHHKTIELWYFPAGKRLIEETFSDLKRTHPNNLIFKTIKFKSRIRSFFYCFSLLPRLIFGSVHLERKILYKLFINYIPPSTNSFINFLDEKIFKLFFYVADSICLYFSSFLQNFIKKKHPITEELTKLANNQSKALLFIIPFLGQGLSIGLKQKKIFVAHDFITIEFEKDFLKNNPKILETNQRITYLINELNDQKTSFICHCQYVKENHLKKFFPKIPESSIHKVFLPVNAPSSINLSLLSKTALEKKFNIDSRFIVYPSQLRPHKNILTLLKALNLIKDKIKIKLLLTWQNVRHDTAEYFFIKENNLFPFLILPGEVSERELYSLYEHASLTVVSTLFEGGFPWQAMESLLMKTPVLISKIPMVLERLSYINSLQEFEPFLFNPHDENDLAVKILSCLENKENIFLKQKNTAELLLKYSWTDTSCQYLNILDKLGKNE